MLFAYGRKWNMRTLGNANAMADIDEAPLFCCCEFIDRHGQRAHLSDAAVCDRYVKGECASCADIVSDIDDRMRLPQYNGAVHVGFDGCLPAFLLPALGLIAAFGPVHSLCIVVVVLPLLYGAHVATVRRRRRPHFFVGWTACTYALGNAAFTLIVGPHIPFGLWVAAAALHVAAAACASATRASAPLAPAASAANDGEVGIAHDPELAALNSHDTHTALSHEVGHGGKHGHGHGAVRCSLCGQTVFGYDHHCIWINACIGAHNMRSFVRGLMALLGAVGLQGVACYLQASRVRRSWGAESVLALYAACISIGLLVLLASLWVNRARGLTAHQVRVRARLGEPTPRPSVGSMLRVLGSCALGVLR